MKSVKIICTIPVVAIAIALTILSSLPNPPAPDLGLQWQDKVYHLIAYTSFGASLALALIARDPDMRKKRLFVWILLGTAFFGIYDEIHQSFVPNRDASFFDWLADVSGACISLLFIPAMRRFYLFLFHLFIR